MTRPYKTSHPKTTKPATKTKKPALTAIYTPNE